jgi:META domain
MPLELARTTWRWVSFTTPEEMLTIADPERYILRFSEGDRVTLRADCNRGAGSVVFPEPGAIRFGALAITRAMCPIGSLGDHFAREVVRAGRWRAAPGVIRRRRCPSLRAAVVRAVQPADPFQAATLGGPPVAGADRKGVIVTVTCSLSAFAPEAPDAAHSAPVAIRALG